MKQTSFRLVVSFLLALAMGAENNAHAQMFGQRSMGTSRSPARTAAEATNVGTVQGNERFIRGNRSASDFVGSTARDSFVGSEQGSGDGRVKSAVSNLRIERAPDANRTAQSLSRRRAMYDPRLEVGFRFSAASSDKLSSLVERRLAKSESIHWTDPVEVSVEGPTATLRGEVLSERDRRLAELLVLFEPGISKVQNELRVKQSAPVPQQSAPMAKAVPTP
ncbi:MAG: BON domain-containing protein [Rhodopirellula sp.]|nr:BON domain-containing protein [Rhodopirellula sp.]